MSIKKLSNYLRAYRKRSGLSQRELAFLFGVEGATVIWRYEQGLRQPGFHNLLAYEFVFQAGGRELFAGEYEQGGKRVVKHAQKLIQKLSSTPPTEVNTRKLRFLKMLVAPEAPWNVGHPAL